MPSYIARHTIPDPTPYGLYDHLHQAVSDQLNPALPPSSRAAPTICRDLLSGRSHSYPAAERSSLGDAVTDDLPTEPRVGEWSAPERPLLLVCRLSHERLGEPVRPPRRPLWNPSSGSWPSAVGTPSSGVGCGRGRGRRPQSPR